MHAVHRERATCALHGYRVTLFRKHDGVILEYYFLDKYMTARTDVENLISKLRKEKLVVD